MIGPDTALLHIIVNLGAVSAMIAGLWLWTFAICMAYSPRIEHLVILVTFMIIGSFVAAQLTWHAQSFLLPNWWHEFTTGRGAGPMIPILSYYLDFIFSIFAAAFSWRWAGQQGDRWFRFEQ